MVWDVNSWRSSSQRNTILGRTLWAVHKFISSHFLCQS
jgi:hypothetical protein